jgi:pimeloyl-ACP methyl ester carboxylesterase
VTVIDLKGHNGLVLKADDLGPADGPKVLLMHGGGQTRRSWGTASANLAEDGMHVVSLDSRGHGESEWDPEARYGHADLALDVEQVLQQIGTPVVIVGASMGGLTGIVAADALGPGAVSGLVLVDVVPRVRHEGSQRIMDFMHGAPDGFADLEEAADAIAAYLPHRPRPKNLEGLKKNLRQRPDGRWVWHWDPAMLSGGKGGPALAEDLEDRMVDVKAAAGRLTIPLVLIRGMLSDIVDDQGVDELRQLAPQLEVVSLEGAAHTAAADDNDGFAAVVRDFVHRLVDVER